MRTAAVACLLLLDKKLKIYIPVTDELIDIAEINEFEEIAKSHLRDALVYQEPTITSITKTKHWLRTHGYSLNCFLEYRIINL